MCIINTGFPKYYETKYIILEQKDRRKGSEYTYVWLSEDGVGDIS